jgi:transposase
VDALLDGKLTPKEMSRLARGQLKKKQNELHEALAGKITMHHVFMIKQSREHIKSVETLIAAINQQIGEHLKPYQQEYEILQTAPGIKASAASLIAELGVNMDQFPTEEHLSSWAGMSPGNNESAGKKKFQDHPWKQSASVDPDGMRVGGLPEEGLLPQGQIP